MSALEQIECDMHGGRGPGVLSEHYTGSFTVCDDCWRKKLKDTPDERHWIPEPVLKRLQAEEKQ